MRERTVQTVRIDRCPDCRGVWLDRGELDTLTGHSASHGHGHDVDIEAGEDDEFEAEEDEEEGGLFGAVVDAIAGDESEEGGEEEFAVEEGGEEEFAVEEGGEEEF